MIKKYHIITPVFLNLDRSANYQKQTIDILKRYNQVILFYPDKARLLLKRCLSFTKISQNLAKYIPGNFVPFVRFKIIKLINKIMNIKILELLLFNKNKIFWVFDPKFHYLASTVTRSTTIFDCVDYFSSLNPTINRKIQKNQLKLLRLADLVFVNSRSLQKIHSKHRQQIYQVPQGFDHESFKKKSVCKDKLPSSKPLVGFIGAVDYRLDFKILYKVVQAFPQFNFVLWGPAQTDLQDQYTGTNQHLSKLKKSHNIIWGLSQTRKKIPNIISQFDICIIPYNVSLKQNIFCYPMKLFEYFYMGKPVISTPIKELMLPKFKKYVRIGKTAEEWQAHIKDLLSKPWPKSYQKEQRQMAIDNSWENKLEAISRVIENYENQPKNRGRHPHHS